MAINDTDVKLFESQRLTDQDDIFVEKHRTVGQVIVCHQGGVGRVIDQPISMIAIKAVRRLRVFLVRLGDDR